MTDQQVSIPGVKIDRFQMTIEGDTPLLCHKFSERSKQAMLDKQMGQPRGPKAPKDPQQDYEECLYVGEDGWYGFPADGIKKACVDTAKRFVDDLHGTEARGAFFIIAQGIDRSSGQPLVMLQGEPEMHESMVRIARGTSDIRYRAMFRKWSITFEVRYNPNVITQAGIVNLLEAAGFHIGIGDWRPDKDGTFGMFHVARGN